MKPFFYFLSFCLLCCSVTAADEVATPRDLVLNITSTKSAYYIGEEIVMNYSIRNLSRERTYLLDASRFSFPTSLFSIKTQDGEVLQPQTISGHSTPGDFVPTIFLGPDTTYSANFRLQRLFPPMVWFRFPHHLYKPGTYEVTAVYGHSAPANSLRRVPELWTGKLVSAPLKLEILPLTPDQVQDLTKALQGGDAEAQLAALDTIARAQLQNLMQLLPPLLSPATPERVRRGAAVTLTTFANEKYVATYGQYLLDKDDIIRSAMALALRTLWESNLRQQEIRKFVPQLLEAADPAKFPNTHQSALRTLKVIGDPRAIPVARKAVEMAVDEEMRYYAQQILKELEAINKP